MIDRYWDATLSSQESLLANKAWNILIILDACRADFFDTHWPCTEVVNATANVTYRFIHKLARILVEQEVLFITANPVVSRELANYDALPNYHFSVARVYEYGWGHYGPLKLPSVHPVTVNQVVTEYLAEFGQPRRMVIHYLQPHAPYIGQHSLPQACWGNNMNDALSLEMNRMPEIKAAGKAGQLDISKLRMAYYENVELVAGYVKALLPSLCGNVVITADHGEMLGENNEFEHSCLPIYPELMTVPWRVEDRGPYQATPIARKFTETEDADVKAKLAALGYM